MVAPLGEVVLSMPLLTREKGRLKARESEMVDRMPFSSAPAAVGVRSALAPKRHI